MFFSTFTLSLLSFSFAFASTDVDILQARGPTCSDVHLFLARGNGEAYPGRVGEMANYVCSGLSSCSSENILFDSTEVYCNMVSDGATAGASQIAAYASACPNSKLVLAGYSLGAQIVGDILGGGGGNFYSCTENTVPSMSASSFPGTNIAAVLMFGNVRHVASQSYNQGDGSNANGQYPRTGSGLSALNAFGSKTQDYCLASDPICALGNDGLSHTTYMEVFGAQAGAWAQQILGYGGAGGSSSSSSSSSAASTAAGSSSGTTTTSSSESQGTTSSTTSSESAAATTSTGTNKAGSTFTSTGTVSASSSTSGSASGSSAPGSVSSSTTTTSASSSTSTGPTTPVNTSTFAPFVFSMSGTVAATATTSTFTPVTSSSIYRAPSATTMVTTTHSGSTSASTSKPVVQSSSKGGAWSNNAHFTVVITLVVFKVLVA